MGIESLVTRFEITADGELYVGFRGLGGIHHPWLHLFVSEILGRKSADKEEQAEAEANVALLEAKLDAIPELKKFKRRLRSKYWFVQQIYCPISFKDLLPKEFLTGHYTMQARRLRRPGDKIVLLENLVDALKARKDIQTDLDSIREEIGKVRKPGYATRTFNDLDEFFDNYDGTNLNDLERKYREYSSFDKLDINIVKRRKEISDRIIELNKGLDKYTKLTYNKKKTSREHVLKLEMTDIAYLMSGRALKAEELLSKNWMFIDIEVPHYKRKGAQITWIGITYYRDGEKKQEIHTVHDGGTENVNSCKVYKYTDENELISKVAELVNQEDPDVVSSYNTKYDLIKLRESLAGFPVGEDETQPLFRSTAKFFERIGIKDRLVIDLMRWQQKARAYDPNAKLAMAAGFEKSESYKEIALLEDKAIAGDSEAARRIATYLAGDVEALFSLFMRDDFRKNLTDLSRIGDNYKVAIERLFHSANSINDAQEYSYLSGLGIYREAVPPHLRTEQMQEKEASAREYFMKNVLERLVEKKEQKGLVNNVFKVYLPYANFFKQMIAVRYPEALQLFKYKDEFRHDKQRLFFLEQYAKEFARWIVTDYGLHLKEVDELDSMLKQERVLAREKIDLNEFEDAYHQFREVLDSSSDYYLKKLNETKLSKRGLHQFLTPEVISFMQKYGLDDKRFLELANQRSKIKRTGRNLLGNYDIFPDRRFFVPEKTRKPEEILVIEDILKEKFREVNEYIKKNNFKIVTQEGAYLYITGDKAILEKEDCPLVLCDEIKTLYNADKPYYEKHGFINDLVLSDEPTYHMNMFEMNNFGKMMRLVFEGKSAEAIELYEHAYDDLRKGRIAFDYLFFHNKSQKRYHAFVNGDRIYFSDVVPEDTEVCHTEYGDYYVASERGKEIIVLLGMPVFKPDLDQYLMKFREKGEAILEPVMRRVEQMELLV